MDVTIGYLDAGSGALIVQLLVGGTAGIAAFLRYRWKSLTGKALATEDSSLAEDPTSTVADRP